jgi:simple sugar transport system permease protein
MGEPEKKKFSLASFQLLLPLTVFMILIVINLAVGAGYFTISMRNGVFYGNIPSVLYGAAELVIIAIGMALVTASSKGQDISVGVTATITSSIFVYVIRQFLAASPEAAVGWGIVIPALLISCVAGALLGAFNGTVVSVFKVQPMVATLILFTAGRSVAFLIDGKISPILQYPIIRQIGTALPGVPIQTPIIITVLCIIIAALIFKLTNLKLYAQTVGINERAARLNGINPVTVKMVSFIFLGVCCAVSGFIAVSKIGRHDSVNVLKLIELDAILAVALGGNALGGGKFSVTGAVIGAYTIEILNQTLLRLQVDAEAIKLMKALFIILLMVLASPVVREYLAKTFGGLGRKRPAAKEAAV